MKNKALDTLRHNVKALMQHRGWSQPTLAKRSGVGQRTISNLVGESEQRNPDYAPTLDTIEKVAASFGLEVWHLQIPDLPMELLTSKQVAKLVENYARSDEEGRENTLRISEMGMRPVGRRSAR